MAVYWAVKLLSSVKVEDAIEAAEVGDPPSGFQSVSESATRQPLSLVTSVLVVTVGTVKRVE